MGSNGNSPFVSRPTGFVPPPKIDFKPIIFGHGGKKIRVTPGELASAAQKLAGISESYTGIYTQLMQQVQNMGAAWEGADNQAFVEQISGFCEELKSMADKLHTASETLRTQAQNYENRVNDNVMQVKKLTK